MSHSTEHSGGHGPSHRSVEIGVALFMALFGAIVIAGSLKVGIGWGPEGPKAGFFPFYIGVADRPRQRRQSCAVAMTRLRRAVRRMGATASGPLGRDSDHDLCGVVPWIGMYVASVLLIALFMKWLGRYAWRCRWRSRSACPSSIYLMFEKWFLVPLPKGPIEDWFGL